MKLPNLNIKKTLIASTASLIVFSVVGIAIAQEIQRTYTVINPQIAVQLDPGTHSEGTTQVINDSNNPLTFNVSVQDYTVTDTKGTPELLPPSTLNYKYSAAAWIGITPSTFTIKPGQKQTLQYFIQVPPSARPGGHYAALVYEPTSQSQAGQTGSTVNTEIGSLFYVTINGPITEKAQVTKFMANGFQEYGPVNVLTEIKNFGDLHIRPTGTVTVSGLFGGGQYKLPQENIFPQTARDFTNIVGQTLMIGQYKAVLLASYGQNNNLPLNATLYFWVFPWRLALVVVLVIIAIILGSMYYRKRKKKSSKSSQEPKTEAETKTEEKTPEKETKS